MAMRVYHDTSATGTLNSLETCRIHRCLLLSPGIDPYLCAAAVPSPGSLPQRDPQQQRRRGHDHHDADGSQPQATLATLNETDNESTNTGARKSIASTIRMSQPDAAAVTLSPIGSIG